MAEAGSGLPDYMATFRSKGWAAFPVRGKAPLTKNGFKDASPDPEQWARWGKEHPGCGWAAPTGVRNGFDVLDADTPEAVAEGEARLPMGPRVRTGGGGMHFYLRHAPDARNWTKRLPGFDYRGEGGYVVLAGSIHENGQPYEWVEGTADLQIPEAPDWVRVAGSKLTESVRTGPPYHQGERNQRLFEMACAIRAKGHEVLPELRDKNEDLCVPPLSDEEVRRIAESAMGYPVGTPDSTGQPEVLFLENGQPVRAAFVNGIIAAHHFAAFEDTEELLVFEAGFYRPHARQLINRWVERKFADEGLSSTVNFRREVYEAVRARSHFPREEFNPSGFLAVRNGLLDLRNRSKPQFGPHDPKVRVTFGLPVDFVPGASCPGFITFLAETQPDPSVRDLLQEESGYILAPGNWLKTAFFWVGESDTGKSTLQSILRGVIGTKNVTAVSLQSLSDNRFASSGLYNKLANFFADLSSRVVRDTGTFKMLTGATDEVPAEKKFQPAFSFVNSAKLFFSANEMPPVPAADDAFYRRWIISDFPIRVPIDRQDPALAGRLIRDEGPGILNWAIEGLGRLSTRGRFDPPSAAIDTARTWRRLSSSLAWFVEAEVIRSPESSLAKAELYARYTEWCEDHDVEPRAQRDVGSELPRLVPGAKECFPKPGGKGTRTVRSWSGIALREPGEVSGGGGLEAYTVRSGSVEPVEPVESGPDFSPGSTGSTGSTGNLGMGGPRERLDSGRWEDDGGRPEGVS
jgi:putative DNA primase/helicase